MRIVVTIGALRNLFAMRKEVTIPALWHQLLPVVFNRTIGMETLVAVLAFESVAASGGLQISVKCAVALSALHRGERNRVGIVKAGGRRHGLWFFLSS